MIRARDALTLAHTKVRSKRLRLLITTIVSALVFGVMAGIAIAVDGANHSLASFAKQNLDGKYLVSGQPNPNIFNPALMTPSNDPAMIKEVEALNKTYLAQRKADALRLGITDYDPASEVPAIVEDKSPGVPEEFRRNVNTTSVAYQRWTAEKQTKGTTPQGDFTAFKTLITPLGADAVYEPHDLSHLQLTWLPDGKEDLGKLGASDSSAQPAPEQNSVSSGAFTIVPDQLVRSYIATTPNATAQPKGIPLLLLPEDALALFGKTKNLPKRPTDSTTQVEWFRSLREATRGLTFTSCYRNAAEQQLLTQARAQREEMANAKNNPDYLPPPLQWAMPTTACGAVTTAKDVRTEEQKQADARRAEFDAQVTAPEKPVAEPLTFEVVGLLPPTPSTSSGIDALLSGIVGVTYSFGAVIPGDSLAALPAPLRHDSVLRLPAPTEMSANYSGVPTTYIASFTSVDKARAAIRSRSCMTSWTPECERAPFLLSTYGTNYLAVDDLTTVMRPVIWGAFLIAFAIATIIIWAMMGRVIADARRETAVFRAIGAKRSDIVAIYLTYSLWVAVRIVLVAAAIAISIALVLQTLYAARATAIAHLAYGIFSDEPRFSFLGFTSRAMWLIFAGIIVMSLIAVLPPLLRNIRRNPIRDMRDE